MHQFVPPEPPLTLCECARCFPEPDMTGQRDVRSEAQHDCPLCHGIGMTTKEAKAQWSETQLQQRVLARPKRGSGEYSMFAPHEDDTRRKDPK